MQTEREKIVAFMRFLATTRPPEAVQKRMGWSDETISLSLAMFATTADQIEAGVHEEWAAARS